MKGILNRIKTNKKVLLGVIFGLITLVAAGGVLAAQILTFHGSVTVTPVGGGGGGTPPPLTYTFKVYNAETGGAEVTDAFFALGNITVGYSTNTTVYVEKTGTGAVTVTPGVTGLDAATGTLTFTPTSVNVADTTRQPILITFTASNTPTTGADSFDVTFTGNP